MRNSALDMGWLPWPVIPKKHWPKITLREKRAITLEEHQAILGHEPNPDRKAFYPERFAQETLGHSSKAVHRAYCRKAKVKLPQS